MSFCPNCQLCPKCSSDFKLFRQVQTWFANGGSGISAKSLALTLLFQNKSFNHGIPSDSDDFERCLKLIKAVPELQKRLPEMITLTEGQKYWFESEIDWGFFVLNWEKLEKMSPEERNVKIQEKIDSSKS